MNKGFTLIELLVALVILGILGAIGASVLFSGSAVSWGLNGAVETRCINGYLTNVSRYDSDQVLDQHGRGIPCKN